MSNIIEKDLVVPLEKYFTKKGFKTELEVPIYRNRIDMVAYDESILISIELKIKKWKRALKQASYYQLGSDFTFVAMPLYESYKAYWNKFRFEKKGVGILAVNPKDGTIRELLKAKESSCKVNFIEEKMREFISKNSISPYKKCSIKDIFQLD